MMQNLTLSRQYHNQSVIIKVHSHTNAECIFWLLNEIVDEADWRFYTQRLSLDLMQHTHEHEHQTSKAYNPPSFESLLCKKIILDQGTINRG